MASIKDKTVFVCSECGFDSPKWSGKCPSCGMWNTMKEMTVKAPTAQTVTAAARKSATGKADESRPLALVQGEGKVVDQQPVVLSGYYGHVSNLQHICLPFPRSEKHVRQNRKSLRS